MSEPMWLQGDPATFANTSEAEREVECGNDPCAHAQEVSVGEQYAHGVVEWFAEWVCEKCGESNTAEGWYDPNDDN